MINYYDAGDLDEPLLIQSNWGQPTPRVGEHVQVDNEVYVVEEVGHIPEHDVVTVVMEKSECDYRTGEE